MLQLTQKWVNRTFQQNTLNAMVFKLQMILLIMEGTKSQKVAFTHLDIGIDSQVTHHDVAMAKVAE